MDTASKFSIGFIFNGNLSNRKEVEITEWLSSEDELVTGDTVFPYAIENEQIELFFKSENDEDRLYFDALDCCPQNSRIKYDEDGLIYCIPGDSLITIYQPFDSIDYDALRVDLLRIIVRHDETEYYSALEIRPKQIAMDEWRIMRDDLETVALGLAQDIVRRNIGAGSNIAGILPPDELYAFLIIHRNANVIASALVDIQKCPKYRIEKIYAYEEKNKAKEIDANTIKERMKRGEARDTLLVPRRIELYDIQENRLLKKIIHLYEKHLNTFIMLIDSALRYHKKELSEHESLYERNYIKGLEEYLNTAEKLIKITRIIKVAEWFKTVNNPENSYVPHSFAVDPRYGTLYRLYNEIKKKNFPIKLDKRYSFSWKKSSALYEMWCFLSVCESFVNHFSSGEKISGLISEKQVFPLLESGSKLTVESEKATFELVYDVMLPKRSNNSRLYDNPLFISGLNGNHNRPDMCINIYSKINGYYIGSIIVECKYRKINSFWKGSTGSSRQQIMAYHNDSKSLLYFGGKLNRYTKVRPVIAVIVLTPDVSIGDVDYEEEAVKLLPFRPSADGVIKEDAINKIIAIVEEQIRLSDEDL